MPGAQEATAVIAGRKQDRHCERSNRVLRVAQSKIWGLAGKSGSQLVCSKVLGLNLRTRQVLLAQNLKAGCTTGALLGTFVHKRKKDVVERQRNEVSSEHGNDTGLVFSIKKQGEN